MKWKEHMRIKTLHQIDGLLDWGLGKRQGSYSLAVGEQMWLSPIQEYVAFAKKYGYFSPTRPLVGQVSSSKYDLHLVQQLLLALYKKNVCGIDLDLDRAEILTKVVAYRDLQLQETLLIPLEIQGQLRSEIYTVDRVFDIWQGMPAFGLVPAHSDIPALLLFRGTDFSFGSKRSFASVLSDLDLAGPGLTVFQRTQPTLRQWLEKVHRARQSAQVMGFSLGGAFASYTFIHEYPLLSVTLPSVSVCGPGLSKALLGAFNKISQQDTSQFVSYVNADDLVSRVGSLFGTIYCLSALERMKPLSAHTALMGACLGARKTRLFPAL